MQALRTTGRAAHSFRLWILKRRDVDRMQWLLRRLIFQVNGRSHDLIHRFILNNLQTHKRVHLGGIIPGGCAKGSWK